MDATKIIMNNIKVAIVGIENCANSLIRGIYYYQRKSSNDVIGLMHQRGVARSRLRCSRCVDYGDEDR